MAVPLSAVLSVLVVGQALAGAEPEGDLDFRVDEAIDRGVEYLLKAVEGREGWTPEHLDETRSYPTGYAALQVYALVKSDVSFSHPVLEKGLAAMEAHPFEMVYSVSLLLMAYGAMLDQIEADAKLGGLKLAAERSRFQGRMNAALTWLLSARLRGVGTWSYETPKGDPRTHWWDHSNTQFAVLALGVAGQHGLKVPREVWEEIAEHFITAQEASGPPVSRRPVFKSPAGPDEGTEAARKPAPAGKTTARKAPLPAPESGEVKARGWRYAREVEDPPRFSMTCAGLSSLLLAERSLGPAEGPRAASLKKALRDGYGWVGEFLEGQERPFGRIFNLTYDLYSLEKVGDLGEVESFGAFRWYDEGAERLLRLQRGDGGWGPPASEATSRQNTALALLFLSRATDMAGRARPLKRITSVGGKGGAAPAGRLSWIYLPSQKAEVPVLRLFRLFRYRPQKQVLKMTEEAVKTADPEKVHELVFHLAGAVEGSPYPTVQTQARHLLAQATGVEHPEPKRYVEWAERWGEVLDIGKEGRTEEVPKLREWLAASQGTPLRARILWALERTRARAALGEVIELLEDPDPVLREAAHSAVVFLSGESFPFQPRAGEKVRAGQVQAIRQWYAGQKSAGSQ